MANPLYYLDWTRLYKMGHKYADYQVFAAFEISALIAVGTDTITLTLDPFLGNDVLAWSSDLKFVSPITGKMVLIAAASGVAIHDGQILVVHQIPMPLTGSVTKTVSVHSPTDKDARQMDNLFIGCRVGNSFFVRPGLEIVGA